MAACLTAVTAAGQAVVKGVSLDGFNTTIHTAIEAASKLSNSAGDVYARNGRTTFNLADHTPRTNNTAGGREMGGTASNGTSANETTPDACTGIAPGSVHDGIAACALALDSNIPPGVRDASFRSQLQNRLGQDLSGLTSMAASNPTNEVLSQAMSAGQSPKTSAALAGLVSDLGGRMALNSGVGSYAGGGGGRRGGGGAPDHMAGIAGLMDKLLGGKGGAKEADTHAGVLKVAAAMKARGPAAVSDDRSLGIFDRVSYRYYALAYQGFGKGDPAPAARPVAQPVAPARRTIR